MIKQLPPKEYAALLCETVDRYDYPTVTYDFTKDKEICHGSIYNVEKCIGDLLHSGCSQDIQDGFAKILYWGHAKDQRWRNNTERKEFKNIRCQNIRKKFKKFSKVAKKIRQSKNNNRILSGEEIILEIKDFKIPQFKSGISFTSKVLMFLDPENYPVLDTKIAKEYVKKYSKHSFLSKSSFRPLKNLTIYNNSISITKNASVYESWACWCREIAIMINASSESTCNHFRAVDVERALFTLANSNKISASLAAESLLAGPANFNIKCP